MSYDRSACIKLLMREAASEAGQTLTERAHDQVTHAGGRQFHLHRVIHCFKNVMALSRRTSIGGCLCAHTPIIETLDLSPNSSSRCRSRARGMAMAANKHRCRLLRALLRNRKLASLDVLGFLTYGLKGGTSKPPTTAARSTSAFWNRVHRMRM